MIYLCNAVPAGPGCARLCLKLFALRASVQDVYVVRCRAVQRLIAGLPIITTERVATFYGATDLSSVGLKDGSFRAIFSLDPPDLAVHVLASAERCGAVLVLGWGGRGAGPALGRPRRCICGVVGLALFDALLVGKVGGPSHIHVGLRCWLRCWLRGWARCRAGRMKRCRAGRRIGGRDLLPLVSESEKSAQSRPLPLPCLLCQCPGFSGRCGATSSEPRAAVRCGAGSPEPRAAWRSRCGVPSRGGGPRGVGGSLGGAGMGSSLGGGGCAGHCFGGGTVSTGGGDALLALLVGIGPKSVRRASRSSASS